MNMCMNEGRCANGCLEEVAVLEELVAERSRCSRCGRCGNICPMCGQCGQCAQTMGCWQQDFISAGPIVNGFQPILQMDCGCGRCSRCGCEMAACEGCGRSRCSRCGCEMSTWEGCGRCNRCGSAVTREGCGCAAVVNEGCGCAGVAVANNMCNRCGCRMESRCCM